jgi:hypothetical protein
MQLNTFKTATHGPGAVSMLILLTGLIGAPVFGQTAAELSAKYPPVSAYEIRPGILMTAKYADDGQVCEMVLEVRHYRTPEKVELSSVIQPKLELGLIDELVPTAERGEPIHRWSNKEPKDSWVDPDSFSAGGMSYVKRSYKNVTVEEYGYYQCHQGAHSSKSKEQVNCGEGGDEAIVIRWRKRACGSSKAHAE